MASRVSKALSLYKSILRTGRKWPEPEERDYIKTEAKTLFRANRGLKSQEAIDRKLFEAEARLELAIHYKNPHPKLYNLSKMATPEDIIASPGKYIKSGYMDSYFDDSKEI
jgi:hypothetical protein